MTISRRDLLAGSAAAAVGLPLFLSASDSRSASPSTPAGSFRAALIGHSGRGDYGHMMDQVFGQLPGVEVVAVADPVAAGREKVVKRSGASRSYDDYKKMLALEKPDLVCVAPRWSEHHLEAAVAAIAAGAHVLVEKPMTLSPADADTLLTAAKNAGKKVAVPHQMRLAPAVVFLKQQVDAGLLGDLLQMHAFGKQDSRAGGEDLVVLGGHLFDLMRMFAGDPTWCTARITDQGKPITRQSARAVREQIGPVAGDEVFAQFAFDRGVNGTFTSKGRLKDQSDNWGVELVGSKASARILADIWPSVVMQTPSPWNEAGREVSWRPIPGDPARAAGADTSIPAANHRVAADWLDAIRSGREPICSGRNAAWGIEMVSAVTQAALLESRVTFPLKDRRHPLM